MTKQDTKLGEFMGMVTEKLDNIEQSISNLNKKEEDNRKDFNSRLVCVEKKQEKFAWYVGVAAGIGAAVMFIVDRLSDLYQRIK
jgi:hypothetical protein